MQAAIDMFSYCIGVNTIYLKRRTFGATASLMGMSPLIVSQSSYPNKPIRHIIPVPAGGGADMIGRATCERMSKSLGQPIVIENISGGGGSIACQTAARAQADGYTLIQAYVATHGTSPATRKLPYDALKDFSAIGMIGTAPNILCVNPAVPTKDLKSLIQYAKVNPASWLTAQPERAR